MNTVTLKDTNYEQYNAHKDKVYTLAYNKGVQALTFSEELRRLCKIQRFNFPGMFAQAWHETDGFTSQAWRVRKNPAGIKNSSGDAYQRYVNGVDAARAFVLHMNAYTLGDHWPDLMVYLDLDVRYAIAKKANAGKTFVTMHDLAGHWAEDPDYGNQVLKVYKNLYGVA